MRANENNDGLRTARRNGREGRAGESFIWFVAKLRVHGSFSAIVPPGKAAEWEQLMCLAVPMQITELMDGGMARVSAMGAQRDVALDLTPQAQVGDFVLVHAGFAIEVVDEQYAAETLDLIKTMSDLVDDPLFDGGVMA